LHISKGLCYIKSVGLILERRRHRGNEKKEKSKKEVKKVINFFIEALLILSRRASVFLKEVTLN